MNNRREKHNPISKKTIEHQTHFREIYVEYWKRLYVYAYQVLKDRELSQDLVQEIFLALWKNRKKVKVKNMSAYLFQSLRFQIYNHFRDNKMTKVQIEDYKHLLASNSVQEIIDLKETRSLLDIYMAQLPNRCREIFYLSRYQNLPHKEIASTLNISTQTVKNQITFALKHLKKNFKTLIIIAVFGS